ncbi:MAG: DMT family transporter, partial [Clostridia bacterium]|nr:DMT family transporter [Clostridia bacterium]
TLAGVSITVFALGASSSFWIKGYLFLLMAVTSYALYCAFVDKASAYTEAEITFMMLVLGAAVFVVLALAEAVSTGTVVQLVTLPFRSRGFLTAVLYQGIGCSVFAFFLSNVAIAKIGVNQTSTFVGVSTVVSIAAGSLLLKEAFTPAQIIGAAVIISGVYIANSRRE